MQEIEKLVSIIATLDQLKGVLRKTSVISDDRRENSAEHSWHVCMIALLLKDYANEPVDISKVVTMLLVHDIPEIVMGDVYLYDDKGRAENERVENDHFQALLGDAPEDVKQSLFSAFIEFKEGKTPEARYANAVDRLQPVLCNYFHEGGTWKSLEIVKEKVLEKNKIIAQGSESLWDYVQALIAEADSKGYFPATA